MALQPSHPATQGSDGIDLSVVIPVRNGADTIAEQLAALMAADKPTRGFEVIVADNGSTDGTADVVLSFADALPVRLVDAGERASSNFARNRGVAAATYPFILLCDSDDRVDGAWLTAMARSFAEGHELVAGPIDYRLLNPGRVAASRGASRASVEVMLDFLPMAHGSNLGFSRALFDRLGGFDEDFGFGGEDVEFCWRAQLAGAELYEAQDALVHYRLRTSLSDVFHQSRAYGASEARLFRKFAPDGVRRRPARALVRDLVWLVTRSPFAVTSGRRGAWVRRLGRQIGRFEGAVKHRVLWW